MERGLGGFEKTLGHRGWLGRQRGVHSSRRKRDGNEAEFGLAWQNGVS